MRSEWKKVSLSDIMTFRNGKRRPAGTGNIPVYGGNGILDFTNEFNSQDCIIIGRVGAYCGSVFREKKKCWISDNAICCVANEYSDIIFDYYLLKSLHLNQRHIGTSQPLLTQEILNRIEILCPPLEQQREIGIFLSAFDDKIELNRKINKNLERQAQAIFQSWFTDGKATNGCLADICQYSQEKVAVSSLDLDSYYSTENMLPGKAGATQAANLPTTAQTTGCKIGDVLVSNIRPYFKKIAYCYEDCGCSTDVLCFTPKQKKLSAYLFFALYADNFFEFMVAGSKGTKMPRGDKQQIMSYPVYVPSDKELTEFNNVAQPVLKQIQLNREENQRLAVLRDTLLPKLMAGEIGISFNL